MPSGRIQYCAGLKNPPINHRVGGEVRPEAKKRLAHLKIASFEAVFRLKRGISVLLKYKI